ncbi:GNAT family N-acetyltransferase [Geobacter sp. DSM 9736]|uniref:GNAT family N-acetyltransferase n=1 Tax=Geobacter sp. DSM 9736 TaxID=1277350 RepID=UPI000B50DE0E|nr:GNAT family N-acetyltransferase [Geobacter sp. DSM 9736]SNB46656.1 dTDP-4-amino-4,6-dideoxy-D-galactose acyltransferase [Geobacter sp. DSM 9736]
MESKHHIEFLPWDSGFFGRRIARLEGGRLTEKLADEALAECRKDGIECLYFLADADDDETVLAAEKQEFHQTDIRVTLEQHLSHLPQKLQEKVAVRSAVEADIKPLAAIARINHRDTRFYYDKRFPTERCDDLYGTWIENSCRGYADAVLTAGEEGTPAGYITCHLREGKTGQIGLLGVGAAFQGKGYGPALVRGALQWFAAQGMERVTVVTQGRNCNAQRLYQKCGFTTSLLQLWYHRWLL